MSELRALIDHNDAPDPDMAPVVDALKLLDGQRVKAALDRELEETQAVDPSAGIVIAPLADMEPTEVSGQTFRYYGARILPVNPETPSYVNPHVHDVGQEPYFILDGTDGEMNTGRIEGERVIWDGKRDVSPGEVIVIQEGQVHSLRNKSDTEAFDFAFASPDSHLQTRSLDKPHGDRMFTNHLDDPLPSHYPKPQQ